MSRDGDEVFLFASHGQCVIKRYNRTGQLLNTWQVKCGHSGGQHLLHLRIGGTPYIAMSCCECKSISLFSMTDSDPITVYTHNGDYSIEPYQICSS